MTNYNSLFLKISTGIETSCDDTAAAIVDSEGNICGEAHFSQQDTHLELGGIIPRVAKDLHKLHIKSVVDQALSNANCTGKDIHIKSSSLIIVNMIFFRDYLFSLYFL